MSLAGALPLLPPPNTFTETTAVTFSLKTDIVAFYFNTHNPFLPLN